MLLVAPAGCDDRADLEVESYGRGSPVTVFAHGLGASIAETRLLATGVPGTRVFFHFRGHGRSTSPVLGWDYPHLAEELRRVADEVGATRALGVSMGAGALTRLLADTPDRFERAVFFLPAVLDAVRDDVGREQLAAMAAAVTAADLDELVRLLHAELPDTVQGLPGVAAWVTTRAKLILGSGVGHALRHLPDAVPVDDRAELASVTVPTMVVTQDGDHVHLARIGRELAEALPGSRLLAFTEGAAVWQHRERLRRELTHFLA